MKKAFMLAGLFLCASAVSAQDAQGDKAAEGRKRNEEAYERMLEQTGWKCESPKDAHDLKRIPAQPSSDPAPLPQVGK